MGVTGGICCVQVLSEQGQAKAVAFNEIDKAPEEKARGITIATVSRAQGGDTARPFAPGRRCHAATRWGWWHWRTLAGNCAL